MNDHIAVDQLELFALEELEPEERAALEEHLRVCPRCRQELERTRALHNLVAGAAREWYPDDRLLQGARQQLRDALRRERMRSPFWRTAWEKVQDLLASRYRVALGGLALLAGGILLGRFMLLPSSPVRPDAGLPLAGSPEERIREELGGTRIANVRFTDAGEASDQVELTFDTVRPVTLKGSVNDPQIQKVLAHAMVNGQNPGVRLRAVSAVASPVAPPADPEIRAALLQALRTDPNAGVRKEALTALQHFPADDEIKNALLNTLMTDRNPGLRIAAINGLDSLRAHGQTADQAMLRALRQKMQSDDNSYIRIKARTVFQEARTQ